MPPSCEGQKCHPCVRKTLLPMSQEGHLVLSGHMGDSSFRAHRYHFRPEGIVDRFEPACLVIEIAQVILHEADQPNAVPDLGDADVLSGEGVTEIHFPALETNATTRCDGNGRVVKGIRELVEASVDAR